MRFGHKLVGVTRRDNGICSSMSGFLCHIGPRLTPKGALPNICGVNTTLIVREGEVSVTRHSGPEQRTNKARNPIQHRGTANMAFMTELRSWE